MGTPWTLLVAVALIVVWALTGPIFGFSDTWQLVINTTTTIITFLMVFVIQTSQNRESKAIQLKLDELIMASERARNQVILADKDTEQELAGPREGLRQGGRRRAGRSANRAASQGAPETRFRTRLDHGRYHNPEALAVKPGYGRCCSLPCSVPRGLSVAG